MGQGNRKPQDHAIDVIAEFHEDFDRALKALSKTMPGTDDLWKVTLIMAMINRSKLDMTLVPDHAPTMEELFAMSHDAELSDYQWGCATDLIKDHGDRGRKALFFALHEMSRRR